MQKGAGSSLQQSGIYLVELDWLAIQSLCSCSTLYFFTLSGSFFTLHFSLFWQYQILSHLSPHLLSVLCLNMEQQRCVENCWNVCSIELEVYFHLTKGQDIWSTREPSFWVEVTESCELYHYYLTRIYRLRRPFVQHGRSHGNNYRPWNLVPFVLTLLHSWVQTRIQTSAWFKNHLELNPIPSHSSDMMEIKGGKRRHGAAAAAAAAKRARLKVRTQPWLPC
jgi:hypothetical protein